MTTFNTTGLALDAWIKAIPDDPYDPCPCGCGKKFRYVAKDEKELEAHETKYVNDWIKNYESKVESTR
jgi:hypothetical protein